MKFRKLPMHTKLLAVCIVMGVFVLVYKRFHTNQNQSSSFSELNISDNKKVRFCDEEMQENMNMEEVD